jgi:type II secretory pathway pseudopilin PulG
MVGASTMRRRQGFTLVELLVAMALIIFIMAILSSAFVAALTTFRNLKAVGDMAAKLRATTQLLRRDLAADHFDGKQRLSMDLWTSGAPPQGFFQIYQGSAPSTVPGSPCFIEGTDLSNNFSYRTVNHTLAFTIKLRGNQLGDFLTAPVPAPLLASSGSFGPPEARYQSSSYNYQWAEVAWFLQPSINPVTGQQDTTAPDLVTGTPGVPLYTLYRRQRLAVPDNSLVAPIPYSPATAATLLEISCWQNNNNFYFNSPTDLTVRERRFGTGIPTNFTTLARDLANLNATNPGLAGSDIQLTDVVSFDVHVMTFETTINTFLSADPFTTLFDPFVQFFYFSNNTLFNQLLPGALVFDTWSSVVDGFSDYSQSLQSSPGPQVIPMWSGSSAPIILGIKVTLRIWDWKTNQTRQVSLVQAM